MNPSVLTDPDFSKTNGHFILDTDASTGHGIGAVLSQKQPDGTKRVPARGSRALHRHERNYATRLEMLAQVDLIDHFRYYFLVRTDHHDLEVVDFIQTTRGTGSTLAGKAPGLQIHC